MADNPFIRGAQRLRGPAPAEPNGNGQSTVAQIAGKGTPRYVLTTQDLAQRTRLTVDWSKTNYLWWDKLRRGKQSGLEIAGLLCNPITQTLTAYTMGDRLRAEIDPDGLEARSIQASEANIRYTNMFLADWLYQYNSELVPFVEDSYALGDGFAFLNPDLSLSIPDPSTVKLDTHPANYRLMMSYTVTTNLDDYLITDTYRLTERTIRVEPKIKTGPLTEEEAQRLAGMPREIQERTFPNLLGQLPVWHFPVERGRNEIFGRPIYEALLVLLTKYDDLMIAGIHGAQRLGKPIPTFEGVEDVAGQIARMSASDNPEYDDVFGTNVERQVINFDEDGVVFAPAGATFNFKSPPPGFTTDVRGMLEMLFLMVMEYSRIPEFAWGGAIASSKASAETQVAPFVQMVKRMRLLMAGRATYTAQSSPTGLLSLLDLVLRMARLSDPRIVVAPLRLKYPILTVDEGKVQTDKVQLARDAGVLSDLGTLQMLGFDIPNYERELEVAQEEQQKRMEEEQAQMEQYYKQLRAGGQPNGVSQ